MDLLIKNMEMPKSCQECRYVLGYNVPMCPDDASLENYLEDERLGRHPCCPLVALPPHGRLIYATEMLEDFKSWFCKDCNNYNEIRCRSCSTSDILDYIEGSRTIVEANT